MLSPYIGIDTPALLIDRDITLRNIAQVQALANSRGLSLRPHIKTHRMPYFAKLQMEAGAAGIACAKIAEAEIMADAGIQDIFIANEAVGEAKYRRLRALHERTAVSIGVDSIFQIEQIEAVFAGCQKPLDVLIEYEVGECRSGVITDDALLTLARRIAGSPRAHLGGIFSHEGHCYKAPDRADCIAQAEESYRRTLRAADLIRGVGIPVETVSVGATPSVLLGAYVPGITEYRIGTYIFMDLGQAGAIGDLSRCAATVLCSVISKPTDARVVLDAGAKALVSQNRDTGICATGGFGYVKNSDDIRLYGLFDEHGLIENNAFSEQIALGDKIEVIPSHICPTVNLYDQAYLVSNGEVLDILPITCRGKSQ